MLRRHESAAQTRPYSEADPARPARFPAVAASNGAALFRARRECPVIPPPRVGLGSNARPRLLPPLLLRYKASLALTENESTLCRNDLISQSPDFIDWLSHYPVAVICLQALTTHGRDVTSSRMKRRSVNVASRTRTGTRPSTAGLTMTSAGPDHAAFSVFIAIVSHKSRSLDA